MRLFLSWFLLLSISFCAGCIPDAASADMDFNQPITKLPPALVSTQTPPIQTNTVSSQAKKTLEPEPSTVSVFTNTVMVPAEPVDETNTERPDGAGFIFPLPDGYNHSIDPSYRYGTTQNGIRATHDGVEFYSEFGSPVQAVMEGTVLFAGNDEQQQWGRFTNYYGNLVIIEHKLSNGSQDLFTLYAHLSKIEVETGERITQGQKIGEVGFSGGAIGSHLHFEVRSGQPLLQYTRNPELFLPMSTGTGTVTGLVLNSKGEPVVDLNISIQPLSSGKIDTDKTPFYLSTYSKDIPINTLNGENFAISNVPAGEYRITTYVEGSLKEKFVRVYAGETTVLMFRPEK